MPAAALLLAALTACSPSTTTPPAATTAAASQAPTETATSTAEPSDATTVAPERPEAMATPSADGAAAAASYFLQLYPYLHATGDLAEWKEMSADDCQFCNNVINDVEQIFAEGNRGSGSEVSVIASKGVEISAQDSYSATIELTQGTSYIVQENGDREPSGEFGEYSMYFALWWRDGWVVREVDVTRVDG
ncbi:hypothetical protein FBY24_1131 [Cellulomonas sp. SLBN-39]|nr:hypothetical protein FBY24_1131 [Cellulomonas sp. SLBN-39]